MSSNTLNVRARPIDTQPHFATTPDVTRELAPSGRGTPSADVFQRGAPTGYSKLLGQAAPARAVAGPGDSTTIRSEFGPDHKVYAVELVYGSVLGDPIQASRLDKQLKAFNPNIPVEGRPSSPT